jgi:YfiH family protein
MHYTGLPSCYLTPDWPAPANIRAVSTTRGIKGLKDLNDVGDGTLLDSALLSGLAGFNLARHVKDSPHRVEQHRAQMQHDLGLERQPIWLNQTHSTDLLSLPVPAGRYDCDGSFTQTKNWPCVVMTADCLPVLLCNTSGTQVAAVHAGWKGLANGILGNAVAQFLDPSQVMVWFGPAIGPDKFEVGLDVLQAFGVNSTSASNEFIAIKGKPDKWLCNLYALAHKELTALGVTNIFGGKECTLSYPDRFYSHRRDPQSGRMASLIWMI